MPQALRGTVLAGLQRHVMGHNISSHIRVVLLTYTNADTPTSRVVLHNITW
jgi:hypothetical protein